MARRHGDKDDKAVDSGDVRARILDRTIYLMGKEGTTDVSVRAIAHEAGVNVAAVNYYFSSKDQMLEQMAERFLAGFNEVMQLLQTPGQSPDERLRRWAAEVMRNLAEYPGVLMLMERQMAADSLDSFGRTLHSATKSALGQLKATLREILGVDDEQRLAFKLTLLISTLAGPFPRQRERDELEHSSDQRDSFLDLLFEHLRR